MLYLYVIFLNIKNLDLHGDWGLGPNPQSPIPNPHDVY